MKCLKKSLSFSLLFSFIMFSITPSVFASSVSFADVEAFFDKQMKAQMDELHIPNATLSVVADGEVILEKGYGYADMDQHLPVNPETSLFRIGSVSKLFTWTAVMQLVEQGKLDLKADVNDYLDFEIPEKLVLKGSAKPAPITLTDLMTHTAGFEDNSESIFRFDADEVVPLDNYVRNNVPLRVFPPGEVVAYCNFCTALAGYMVERVSGLPFTEYIEQNIYGPLGMMQSTFRQPLPTELASQMSQAYRYVDGEYRKGEFEFMPESAGGMSSTAADMARFMLAYLQGGQVDDGRILSEETVQLMRQQQFAPHHSLQGIAYGFQEGMFNGHRTLFHNGSTMTYDAGLYILPEEQVGIFISYSGGNYLVHKTIFQEFLDYYYPDANERAQLIPPEGTKERSSQYVGEYHQNRKSFTTSEKFVSLTMGMIHVSWDDEGYLLVNHVGDTYRFVEVEPGVYHNLTEEKAKDPFGDFGTIVFDKDPLGHVMLLADGPMSYSKAPWYSTSSFTFLILIASLIFIIGSLVYKGISGGIRMVRRRKVEQTKLAYYARWALSIYGVLALGLVLGVALTSDFDPVYGLPKAYFGGLPAWASMLDMIPLLMVLVGVALIICTVFVWLRKYWTVMSRVHYSFFTATTIVLFWLFNFWNLL